MSADNSDPSIMDHSTSGSPITNPQQPAQTIVTTSATTTATSTSVTSTSITTATTISNSSASISNKGTGNPSHTPRGSKVREKAAMKDSESNSPLSSSNVSSTTTRQRTSKRDKSQIIDSGDSSNNDFEGNFQTEWIRQQLLKKEDEWVDKFQTE